MISHENKCIFLHIPKSAGTSIKYFLFPDEEIHWFNPNYEVIHGWCPKRKFFMQHATAKQLLDTELVTLEQWNSYFKFSFVRNPWDRAVSDYFWLMNDRNINDSFSNYLSKSGKFTKVLNDVGESYYRGDHLIPQSNFFSEEGMYTIDFVGRFENFNVDIAKVIQVLGISKPFDKQINVSKKKKKHYSQYYSKALKEKVTNLYSKDIVRFNYEFDDMKSFIHTLLPKLK